VRRRLGAIVVSLAVTSLVAAGCGSGGSGGSGGGGESGGATPKGLPAGTPGQGKPSITLGTKDFAEEFLLGDLYEQALKAKGFTVDQKQNIGASEVIDKAFSSGQIDFYPEYTGEIVSTVGGYKQPLTSKEDTYNRAKKFEETKRDATLLPQTPFEDIDVVAVKPDFAKKYKLKSIADLENVGPKGKGVKFAAQPPSKTRYQGFLGMQQAYGLTAAEFVGVQVGVTYTALDKGSANTADVFSTDGQLTTGKYVVLQDPKNIMGFQHVAPVVKNSVLKEQGPAFTQTLNWVNSLLTTEAMQKMNAAVQIDQVDPAVVAKKFLAANGLK
jgi:osmoprotectant transport system substrate-binding protein